MHFSQLQARHELGVEHGGGRGGGGGISKHFESQRDIVPTWALGKDAYSGGFKADSEYLWRNNFCKLKSILAGASHRLLRHAYSNAYSTVRGREGERTGREGREKRRGLGGAKLLRSGLDAK